MKPSILKNLSIPALNNMQQDAITASRDSDLILISPTGSGKTLAFLFPILERIKQDEAGIQALILAPSRELARQIEQVWRNMQTGHKVNCFYGGHSTRQEKASLSHPPSLLIGTPGRIAYHIRNENFTTNGIRTLILDEFDKSLELGFHQEMEYIIQRLPNVNRRILTSATVLKELPYFTGISEEVHVLDFSEELAHKPQLSVKAVSTLATDKAETLLQLLCFLGEKSSLVFCNHREAVERISDLLYEHGVSHGVFHGGMDQAEREKSLLQFKNGTHAILVCTDLASRGLDIEQVDNIIHYQLPNLETFIHRNGRTARMRKTGQIFLIVHDGNYPDYLTSAPEEIRLPEDLPLPPATPWITIYFGAGKKQKVNKVDIVGLVLKKGGLEKQELGKIEVFDDSAYAAVKRSQANGLLQALKNEKLKNKKVKIALLK